MTVRTYDEIKAEAQSIPKTYELVVTEAEARLIAREISLAWTFHGRRIRITA
jgi:hypothetical protein